MISPALLRRTAAFAALSLCAAFCLPAHARLTIYDLRCDWAVEPRGIDSAVPHLAWKLSSPDRGARQIAWQVQVASSRAQLLADEADVWDSGRQAGDAQFQVAYDGRPLATGEQVFWRVRAWDDSNGVAEWSAPASWTMGVVNPADWKAHWITDPTLEAMTRQWLGFSTPPITNEHTTHWVALDLGSRQPIDSIRLHAVVHSVSERLGFPRWFRVELAGSSDFHDAQVMADHTADPINEWFTHFEIKVPQVSARYLRLTAPRLRMMSEDGGNNLFGRVALSQIEVFSGGKNVALGAAVSASESLEGKPWSARALVDGLELPGGNPRAASTLLLRREFPIRPHLRRATLFVCGLGHYALGVNGQPVARDALLTPGWTDYAKTCLYDTHDLTAQLHEGTNAIGLTLANGMYNVPNVPGRYTKFTSPPRALKALAQLRLEYADGAIETVVTDEHWRAASGPIMFSHVYGGEDYDPTREPTGWLRPGFRDAKWTPVALTSSPGGTLRGASASAPSLRAHEALTPVAVRTLRPGVEVYDFGQNTAMMPRLRVRGAVGSTVKLIPAELLSADGSVDWNSTHHTPREAVWNYRLTGALDGESWMPLFFYHGARYLQVERTAPEGKELPVIEPLESVVVHSDSAPVGEFACSNELFNRIRTLVRWAQRSNMVSVLTDCPHRERLAWLEQYHLNGPSLRSEFELTRLYAKCFQDMEDSQRPNGLITSTSPEYIRFDGDYRDSPEWGSALILAAWQQYVWTGDDTPLHRHYGAMQRYFAYLTGRAKGRLLSHGLGDWCDVGPNGGGYPQLTPIPFVATATYHEDARAMERIAAHLGRTDDAQRYAADAAEIAEAFNAAFFDPKSATYATASQTAQAFPLVLELAPAGQHARITDGLIHAIRAAGNGITAGEIGFPYLLRALTATERPDVIFDIVNQTTRPGYGYQLARGATSLTESWTASPHASQNHFMMGQILEWFYQGLAGLAPDPSAPGFGRIVFQPQPVGDVAWAEARYDSVRGPVAIRWNRSADVLRVRLAVPANARARFIVPGKAGSVVTECGRPIGNRTDVIAVSVDGRRPAYEIGAGTYDFEIR